MTGHVNDTNAMAQTAPKGWGSDVAAKLTFYQQVCAALIRREGGEVFLTVEEFECGGSVAHRKVPPSEGEPGIQIRVNDHGAAR
jgi:hypothetical protein